MSDEIELIRLRQRYGQTKEALAEEKAENERLRGSADAWWTEYDRELKAHEATKAGRELEQNALRNALPIVARESALREAVEGLIRDLDAGRADGTIYTYGQVQAAIRAALAAAPAETEPEVCETHGDVSRNGEVLCCGCGTCPASDHIHGRQSTALPTVARASTRRTTPARRAGRTCRLGAGRYGCQAGRWSPTPCQMPPARRRRAAVHNDHN